MYRDTYITGVNPSSNQILTVQAFMFDRGGTETRTVRRTAAPWRDWEFNLADWWERPGRNVNVGVVLTCDGPCPAYVASYFDRLGRGVPAAVTPVLVECP